MQPEVAKSPGTLRSPACFRAETHESPSAAAAGPIYCGHSWTGLNASGHSPGSRDAGVFAARNLTEIPTTGPLSWSVPGCVSGWADLHGRFGSQPLPRLLAPAIQTAEDGFPVSELIAVGY